MNKKFGIIPVFVPMLGCPHRCVFCNQHVITGRSVKEYQKDLEKQLGEALKTYYSKGQYELAFYGGSFTCLSEDLQVSILNMAKPLIQEGKISGIRVSTRPDAIHPGILELLLRHHVSTIELGIQSTDPLVLKESGRGHSREDIYSAVAFIKQYPFHLGLQMMIGLPGDTYAKSLQTVLDIISLKPDFVRIYPTLVLKDSILEKQYLKGQYIPLSLEQAVEWVKDLKMLFDYHCIPVIRIGLQANEGLDRGRDYLAGPYHPAFGELVENGIYLKVLYKMVEKLSASWDVKDSEALTKAKGEVKLYVPPHDLSKAIGQRRRNLLQLSKLFPDADIDIKANSTLEEGELMAETHQKSINFKKNLLLRELVEGILEKTTN